VAEFCGQLSLSRSLLTIRLPLLAHRTIPGCKDPLMHPDTLTLLDHLSTVQDRLFQIEGQFTDLYHSLYFLNALYSMPNIPSFTIIDISESPFMSPRLNEAREQSLSRCGLAASLYRPNLLYSPLCLVEYLDLPPSLSLIELQCSLNDVFSS